MHLEGSHLHDITSADGSFIDGKLINFLIVKPPIIYPI